MYLKDTNLSSVSLQPFYLVIFQSGELLTKKLTHNTNTHLEDPSPNSTLPQPRARTTGPDDLQDPRCQPHWEAKGRTCGPVVTLLNSHYTALHFPGQWVHGHSHRSGCQVPTMGGLDGGPKATACDLAQNQGNSQPTHYNGEGGCWVQMGSRASTLCGLAA